MILPYKHKLSALNVIESVEAVVLRMAARSKLRRTIPAQKCFGLHGEIFYVKPNNLLLFCLHRGECSAWRSMR